MVPHRRQCTIELVEVFYGQLQFVLVGVKARLELEGHARNICHFDMRAQHMLDAVRLKKTGQPPDARFVSFPISDVEVSRINRVAG
jgi:hypothetical protein